MKGKPTIRDIARLASVSTATVSRVVNGHPVVDAATRERVLRVIEEQGYVPDHAAVQLASQSSGKKVEIDPSFPADFLWGAATSAYQIEGAAHEDGREDCIWDAFARVPGAVFKGDNAEVAADHYHRIPEDVALMAELHLNAYRFSLSWSRIIPGGTGIVNARGLDFYDRLVDALLARGICPVATLYHWDLPLALHEKGGWLARETAYAFADYTEVMVRRLGDRVSWWITLNEPWCSAYLGYGLGIHAPGIHNMQAAVAASHHLLLAHGLALQRIRRYAQPELRAGITLNLTPVFAADDSSETVQAVEQTDALHNRWFLDPLFSGQYPERLFADLSIAPPPIEDGDMELIAAPLEFLGVNYYSRTVLRTRRQNGASPSLVPAYETVAPVPGASYTETPWEIYPRGLVDALEQVHRDYAPPLILVTENGAAFADQWDGKTPVRDQRRVEYLHDHIEALALARRQGIPVGGYFIWSLLDNYEWADGYSKRFGIVYVDYATQRRVIKESGRWYAALIKAQQQNRQIVSSNGRE